jgi:CheY-like chemotaxis protein
MHKVKSILIVEDNPTDRYIIEEVVKRSGLTEHSAVVTNGQEALDYLEKTTIKGHDGDYRIPDIILLDLHMPVMSGVDFMDAFKAKFGTRFHSAIFPFINTRPEMEIFKKWKTMIMGYVEKPLTAEKIKEVVETYMN